MLEAMTGLTLMKTFAAIGAVAVLAVAGGFLVREPADRRLAPFGTVRIVPDMFLDGDGTNMDSPEFFEADDPRDTLLLVSGKGNDLVEVWKFPFLDNQLAPLKRDSRPNGLDIDQDRNFLLIGDSDREEVEVRLLPGLAFVSAFGRDVLDDGETNLDTLTLPDGGKRVYVSENREIVAFDLETGETALSFRPEVESIEEILADSYHQVIYVAEENGAASKMHPGGAVIAYYPDGKAYPKDGSNVFGQGLFTGDEEGMALYACPDSGGEDGGRGFIIVANQAPASRNRLKFFDRVTWEHLGDAILEGVSGTDGIAVTGRPLPGYPKGIMAVTDSDKDVALVSWEKIADAADIRCAGW